ncbi:PPE family protein [Mycobacterium kansasii]|uniref:PPE family protein n=1 Tax=Mycobacterium kansasii TaxID=1768 RepID=UPI0004F5FCF3|nr:PPE family protein [Mycobacterium kansasii]MXO37397.1 PPE family protein [Mycobacterium kansasii]POX70502.1 PPE family protein [Mycobacterium kansasii]POX70859.1 PPE family protein [Mycobacterium kansasii]POX77289.1 PPE family protein [Mycobacterium kansasii]POX89618.1 PPE family protein [Mycobacterium kansasii]
MVFDFALLPPEVNSARMYTGPGSASLRTAAASWQLLAVELHSAASMYRSVVMDLTSMQWTGSSSMSMAAAVIPYVDWLTVTAEQAGHTAAQATAAATAFEQAFAMTVPPPLIAANRAELLALIATNFFGQNTAAIATTEAQYMQMWAQDATAMDDYTVASAAAWKLTPFASPQPDTNPAGRSAQHAAVTRAITKAPDNKGNWIGNLLKDIGAALTAVGLPEVGVPLYALGEFVNTLKLPKILKDDFTALDALFAWYSTMGSVTGVSGMTNGIINTEKSLGLISGVTQPVAETVPKVAPALLAPLNSIAKSLSGATMRAGGVLGGQVSAAARSAGSIGQLSVPPSWATPQAAVAAKTFQAATPLTTLPTSDAAPAAMPGLPGMPSAATGRAGVVPRYGLRMTVMSRPLSGG